MTAAQSMLDQADRELTQQYPSSYVHVENPGRPFTALNESPDSSNPIGEGVGLRFGEEHMIAIVARKNQFTRLPIVGEHLRKGSRIFPIADVRTEEDGHLVGFICPQPPE